MDPSDQSVSPWFKRPVILGAGAVGAVAIAITAAAMGIASARTGVPDRPSFSTGALSVVMQAPPEPGTHTLASGRMATLDQANLAEQAQTPVSPDPVGDENLRVIEAQERRLQAMNDRETAAFAAQMRQTEAEDGLMEREVRTTNDTPLHTGYTTSNSAERD